MIPEMRPVSPDDLEVICRHRLEMFRDAGRPEPDLALMMAPFRQWLEKQLSVGAYRGFVVHDGAQAIGGVGLMLIDWPPHPAHPLEAHRGYVLNLYVEPSWRGRGIGRALMGAADDELIRLGVSFAVLHSTTAGRPLYERVGWRGTSEMSRALPPSPLDQPQPNGSRKETGRTV